MTLALIFTNKATFAAQMNSNLRFHRNLVFATIDSLHLIFNEDKQADKVLKQTLKRDKRWGARDRGFIAETSYDIVRWIRLYAKIADVKSPYKREDLFRVFAVWAVLKGHTLPNWPQFEGTPERRIRGRYDELSKERVYRESIPDWLDAMGLEQLGGQWEAELKALNQQAQVVLRANTLKTDKRRLKDALEDSDIYTNEHPNCPDALVLKERTNVFTLPIFKEGWFEVQDISSQQVGELLDVKPGMRVVDACAGAGGKTLHLAALMQNKGQIIATDIYDFKLTELKRRARRAGAHNVETRFIDSPKVYKKLYGSADRVLIDAPCSGLGVLKRNPDSKWKLSPEFMQEIQKTQAEILERYSKMVKAGGKLVYATCSILPAENQEQVARFLESEAGAEFTVEEEKSLWPSKTGFDGFYMCLLSKSKA